MIKKAKFVPVNDLTDYSDEQLAEYYNNVCEYYEVPPELHLLYFELSDFGDGARKKVLYASKGFTDFMRGKLGIETDSLEEVISDGVVRYKCTGHDKQGRHEIAIGASDITGLSAKKKEFAFSIAQTRATKRMTLQFVGAGILDESEKPVNSLSVDISSAALPLAKLPTVEINSQKGLLVEEANKAVNRAIDLVNQQHPLAGDAVKIANEISKTASACFTSEMQQQPFVFPETATEVANGELRRKPGPRNSAPLVTVEEERAVDTGHVDHAPLAEIDFKQWLSKLTNITLPIPPSGQSITFMTYGGMKPDAGFGGPAMKIRLFARKIIGKEIKDFTVEEQMEFRLLFDNKLKEVGAQGLVKYVNEMIGVKDV